PNGPPLVIDLAVSRVARGKIMAANNLGQSIPEGWALDQDGKPTTNAADALGGTMIPIGEAKGAALALMVEVMSACLTGSNLAFQASSFFEGEGPAPNVGQTILALDPIAFSGEAFFDQMAVLEAAYNEDGARLPGTRRFELREDARNNGIEVADALMEKIQAGM
ncbi:MAG: Ldh family oxidoreductase, partial [Pseudomonadota bacterium]